MSTTFWLPSDTTAAVSPTPSGTDWAHINTVSRELHETRATSALTTLAYAPDAGDHLSNVNSMVAQFVSRILPPQTVLAQVIGLAVMGLESNAANNQRLMFKVYAVDVTGTSVLGTLAAISADTRELGTSLDGRSWIATSTQVVLSANWRLVVEIGGGSVIPGAGGNHNISLQFGEAYVGDGVADLSNAANSTPRLEFQYDLQFRSLPAVGDVQQAVTYGIPGSELTGTLVVPVENDVLLGVDYGAAGTEFEGDLVLPSEAQVESGVAFGADGGLTGSFAGGGSGIVLIRRN